MKKFLCLLLCLLLPLTAMAAPVRDMRESVLSESELATMRAWLDKTVREALPVEYDGNTYVGAYVYSCVEDGGCYVLECDVYLQDGSDSLPEMAADEALTWLCDATVCIKRAGGGYELARDPSEISMKDVIELIDGEIAISKCLLDEHLCSKQGANKSACAVHRIFDAINRDVSETLGGVTIASVVGKK